MNFESDPRRQQELRARPLIDKIYRSVWGNDITIARFEAEDDYTLDKEFAIDVITTFPNGQRLIGQEKALSYKYAHFGTLTIEYEQNQHTGEKGDWFNAGWMFYFTGYENADLSGLFPWVIANYPALVLATQEDRVYWWLQKNKDGSARANFMCTKIVELPDDVVIAKRLP